MLEREEESKTKFSDKRKERTKVVAFLPLIDTQNRLDFTIIIYELLVVLDPIFKNFLNYTLYIKF